MAINIFDNIIVIMHLIFNLMISFAYLSFFVIKRLINLPFLSFLRYQAMGFYIVSIDECYTMVLLSSEIYDLYILTNFLFESYSFTYIQIRIELDLSILN